MPRDKEKRAASFRRWKEANRVWVNEYNRKVYILARMKVIEGYGGKCSCCGEATVEFLAIDHIGGGGGDHRRGISRPDNFYRLLIKLGFPKEYRLLCHNCNMAITIYSRCPHERQHRKRARPREQS